MVKPDGVARGLVHEIIRRWESRGFTLVGIKILQPDEALCKASAPRVTRTLTLSYDNAGRMTASFVGLTHRAFCAGALRGLERAPVLP